MSSDDTHASARSDENGEARLDEIVRRLAGRQVVFSRYEVRGEVGRGGMGTVLRIWDGDLRRELAMKVVRPTLVADDSLGVTSHVDPRVLDRFLEEAQITGQLDHPGIVPVHEMGLDPAGQVYFTMRLVAGRDLEAIFRCVREGTDDWTVTRAVGVLLKVCESVAYAHSKQVVHRDLKPANVMVGRFGEVYVMDWGLARVLGAADKRDVRVRDPRERPTSFVHTHRADARLASVDSPLVTMDGDVVGTPAYMSPEQARGDVATLGPATDVYAVGAMLYHLLAGHAPYVVPGKQADAIAVWKGVRAGPPEAIEQRAPSAPQELVAVCEKAMAREPAERYASMLDLAEDLRAWLEGRVVSAYETGAYAELKKWVLRNKALATTIAVALVVIVAGTSTAAFVFAGKNEDLRVANGRIQKSETLAKENAQVAIEQARIAEERSTRILRLSDVRRLSELEESAAKLWPAEPRNVAAYVAWLDAARALVDRLPVHAKALEELRASALAEPDALGATSTKERAWHFASTEDAWQHALQQELVAGLEAFRDPTRGRIADVERRLAFARSVEDLTLTSSLARARWRAAIDGIADAKRSPKYAGLAIAPQLGLLPLGQDPQSGLWEFAHVQTGAPPEREVTTGTLVLTEASALVLVLIPGGTFSMGSQSDDPTGENFDAQARGNEGPVERVTLAPFFLAKHEMTQGQWLRFTGSNPSIYGPSENFDGKQHSLLHPVEQVSWYECERVVKELGLVLPTEAQWEYAARAGTETPWWTGDEMTSLDGAANLADRAAARVGANWPGIAEYPELDDGYAVHAPIGHYRANAFGLHDVHGNVWEWCADWLGNYSDPVDEGTGLRRAREEKYRVSRGGGFYQGPSQARVAYRNPPSPDTRSNHLGLRPARALAR